MRKKYHFYKKINKTQKKLSKVEYFYKNVIIILS